MGEYDPDIDNSYLKQFALDVDKERIDTYTPNSDIIWYQHDEDRYLQYKDNKKIHIITFDTIYTTGQQQFSALSAHWAENRVYFFWYLM